MRCVCRERADIPISVRNLRPLEAVLVAALALLAFDVCVFWLPLYRPLLAPDSTTGSFERTLAAAQRIPRDPIRDVLVLGDSRIADGLLSSVADRASRGLHFINAGIPGTTPRVWDVFTRALDPQASRYRAVVIAVDTYSDDDSAIGSEDNDDRLADLHYVALRATPEESERIALSFGPLDEKLEAFVELGLRAPLLRDDVQTLLGDPLRRYDALRTPLPDLAASRARSSSLAGLHADYHTQTIAPNPAFFSSDALARLRFQIFHVAQPSDAYARYRREWVAPIVERYRERGVPVLFVRIPARPIHAAPPPPPSGTLPAMRDTLGAGLLPQEPYVALERPALFSDAEHLDRAGAARFSAQLGSDVAFAIVDPLYGGIVPPAPRLEAAVATPPLPRATVRAARPSPAAIGTPGNSQLPHLSLPVVRFRLPTLAVRLPQIAAALQLGKPIALLSYEFAIFFIIVACAIRALPNEPARRALLLLASWYFYARWNAIYLAVLVALTALDYVLARSVEGAAGTRKRVLLAAGVGANLAFLGVAKYADFFSSTLAHALGRADDPWLLHLLVPVGISFHTFQSISYIDDISRGKIRAERHPLNYALYIAFFPQLLAGPIVRAERFFRELYARRAASAEHVVRGLGEIALGIVKKSAIADRFAPVADAYYGAIPAHPGAPAAWCAALAFAMQIYFDFSGYTDIAIGCARILGFDFPQNFHRPYLAWSITEFWRRWHMTLSSWLRDYLYIPLGGNRYGALATYRNLMLTMLLGGLWHGANWTFVVWGGYHGLLLAGERALGIGRKREAAPPRGLRRVGATLATFGLVAVGWVFFRAQSFGDAFATLHALALGGAGPLTLGPSDFAIVAVALGIECALEARLIAGTRRVAFTALTLLALELGTYPGAASPFVYFKF